MTPLMTETSTQRHRHRQQRRLANITVAVLGLTLVALITAGIMVITEGPSGSRAGVVLFILVGLLPIVAGAAAVAVTYAEEQEG